MRDITSDKIILEAFPYFYICSEYIHWIRVQEMTSGREESGKMNCRPIWKR